MNEKKKCIYIPQEMYDKLYQAKSITHKPFWAIIEDWMNYYYQAKED